jgi:hypothetical protein
LGARIEAVQKKQKRKTEEREGNRRVVKCNGPF